MYINLRGYNYKTRLFRLLQSGHDTIRLIGFWIGVAITAFFDKFEEV